ncbi:MAG: aldo/keto reductase [Bifidobacteriaceae bacterium]|jgi:D-threo-aldose 1-dehydrogenase|nr:aldo/keto reductase [Bifidobacteriaceae bacterium]
MKQNRVGRTDVEVTELGLGTAQLGDLYEKADQQLADAVIEAAWASGIRYFDTAPHYGVGLSEKRTGRALAAYPRSEFALSTKVGRLLVPGPDGEPVRQLDYTAKGVLRSLDESRERLGLDRIDIALIHDPTDATPRDMENAIQEAAPALAEARAAGTIGAFGVGTRDNAALLRFVRETAVDVVMVAGRMTLLMTEAFDDLVPECAARGVSIFNSAIFNTGILAKPRPTPTTHFEYAAPTPEMLARVEQMADASEAHGLTLPEAAMAFALAPATVAAVVVGASKPSQIERSVAWATTPRDPAELAALWRDLDLDGFLR